VGSSDKFSSCDSVVEVKTIRCLLIHICSPVVPFRE
jgi:hypothetical protein